MLYGYVITVAIETLVLLVGLSRPHPLTRRLLAGFWLTACTYPIVVLVLPILIWQPAGRLAYLLAAETFAPLAECGLFYAAFLRGTKPPGRQLAQDFAAIVLANLASFGIIEVLRGAGWVQW
ncbi:MAG: hypothetical protein K8T91_22065 [Planctomycetes bacterium]|nr:hypothetical protein [Planctomycetota bacterium]